jgi:hypothetical protein
VDIAQELCVGLLLTDFVFYEPMHQDVLAGRTRRFKVDLLLDDYLDWLVGSVFVSSELVDDVVQALVVGELRIVG